MCLIYMSSSKIVCYRELWRPFLVDILRTFASELSTKNLKLDGSKI